MRSDRGQQEKRNTRAPGNRKEFHSSTYPTYYKILIARVIMKYVIIIRNEKGREKFNDILKWTPDDDDDK